MRGRTAVLVSGEAGRWGRSGTPLTDEPLGHMVWTLGHKLWTLVRTLGHMVWTLGHMVWTLGHTASVWWCVRLEPGARLRGPDSLGTWC